MGGVAVVALFRRTGGDNKFDMPALSLPGVKHNIPILRDIITQPSFVSGDISTNFLQEVYPKGFKGHPLSATERDQLIAAAAYMHLQRKDAAQEFLNQERYCGCSVDLSCMPAHCRSFLRALPPPSWEEEEERSWDLLVKVEEKRYPVRARFDLDGFQVEVEGGGAVNLECKWNLGDPLMVADVNGEDVTVQYEARRGQTLILRHCGSQVHVSGSHVTFDL